MDVQRAGVAMARFAAALSHAVRYAIDEPARAPRVSAAMHYYLGAEEGGWAARVSSPQSSSRMKNSKLAGGSNTICYW